MKDCIRKAIPTWLFLVIFNFISAQSRLSSYGLPYINSIRLYKESLVHHPEKQMISLSIMPGIILDLRYASENNFMHKKLYPGNIRTTFLRKPVYEALDSVRVYLATLGYEPVIFDAYRPYHITEALWEKVKNDKYAANPAKGSGHNRGIAIDLSIASLKTRNLVIMPTDFDDFSDSAHQDFKGADPGAVVNRDLLLEVMKKYGFIPLSTEWWHFSWPDPDNFEVLDLSFEQLDKLK